MVNAGNNRYLTPQVRRKNKFRSSGKKEYQTDRRLSIFLKQDTGTYITQMKP